MVLSNPYEPDPRVYKESRSLVNAGYSVTVLAWDRLALWPARQIIDGLEIIRIQSKGTYGSGLYEIYRFINFYLEVLKYVKKIKPSIIHCHDLDTSIIGLIADKFYKIKGFIYDAHEPDYYGHFPVLGKYLLDRLEKFISRKAKKLFVTNLIQVNKFEKFGINSPILLRNVPDLYVKNDYRRSTKSKPVIGLIGYIKPGTGINILLETAYKLREDFPNLHVQLIGKIFQPYEPEFKRLISKFNSIVEYVGFVPYPKVLEYYKKFTISILLYEKNSEFRYITPTKLYEAMAFGVPVLVSSVGDVELILSKYQCGILLKNLDFQEVYKMARELLSDQSLLEKYSRSCRLAFRKEFNWLTAEKQLLSAYGSLISNN